MNKKNIALLALGAALVVGGCRKHRFDDVSEVVTASYPTVTLTGDKFYSIPVGAAPPSVSATAYDSTLGESYSTSLDASGIDASKPGLYIVNITATNKYGYIGSNPVYIAVTDIDPALDISGLYTRNGNEINVTKIANGLYETDNLGGANVFTTGYFVVINDSTIDFPVQPTADGDIGVRDAAHPDDYGFLSLGSEDTSFGYKLNAGGGVYGTTAFRTFVKE